MRRHLSGSTIGDDYMHVKTDSEDTRPLVVMEEQVAGESGDKVWVRVPQYPRLLHPVHGDACLRDLRRVHKSRKFRLTPVPDEDIPF